MHDSVLPGIALLAGCIKESKLERHVHTLYVISTHCASYAEQLLHGRAACHAMNTGAAGCCNVFGGGTHLASAVAP
jgi:hypothetical protein